MKKFSPAQGSNADLSGPGSDEQTISVRIEAIGAQGHGEARVGGTKVHIPFTLPGETVFAAFRGARGEAQAIECASPDRIAPVCRHFGICGGCSLQHWRETPYSEWKLGLVTKALVRERLDVPAAALRSYPASSRRRAIFTGAKEKAQLHLGFNVARSHDLVDLAECPVLLPQIVSALPHLREALAGVLPNSAEAKIHVTAAENGLDCNVTGPRLPAQNLAKLAQMLPAAGIIRTVWNSEIALLKDAPFVVAGGVKVLLPHGAFLQAVQACEHDMAAFVTEALSEMRVAAGPVCDLFAGLGAFSFPCAKRAPVRAFEESAEAAAALNAAAKGAAGIKPVKAVRRDLFRNPLGPMELNAFAAVVLDPPREGAETQCRALAASKVGAAVMLSCNPVAFARDAAILTTGGFRLYRLAAFDQFKFSSHVEIAGAFKRPASKKGRLSPALKR